MNSTASAHNHSGGATRVSNDVESVGWQRTRSMSSSAAAGSDANMGCCRSSCHGRAAVTCGHEVFIESDCFTSTTLESKRHALRFPRQCNQLMLELYCASLQHSPYLWRLEVQRLDALLDQTLQLLLLGVLDQP